MSKQRSLLWMILNIATPNVCANIDITHHCLSNGQSESDSAVPSSRQKVKVTATRPTAADERRTVHLPNLFHHEVGRAKGVCFAYMPCSQWRQALLKVEPKMAVRFHLFSTGVYLCPHCSYPHSAQDKVEAVSCWFWGFIDRRVERAGSLVYLAMVVLIGLVNRIFHKRSNGLEQFVFSAKRGMCLFHSLKGDFCAAAKQLFVCQHSLVLGFWCECICTKKGSHSVFCL